MSPSTDPWIASRRIEAWAGESRLNMVRAGALLAFYTNHLVHLHLYQDPSVAGRYHFLVTLLVVAGIIACLLVARLLAHRLHPPWFPHVTTAWDTLIVTSAAALREGPGSPIILMYFLIIAGSSLRLAREVVIGSLVAVSAGYFYLLSFAKLYRPELGVPHPDIAVTYLCFGFTAVLAGQSVRQARRLVRGHPVPVTEEAA